MGAIFAPFFDVMKKNVRNLTSGAIIAALYVVLTYMQNLLLPGSTSMAIQFRASEALCVLAFFTPSAIWGLGIGCLLFNITNAGALPLDTVIGTAATLLATGGMHLCRKVRIKSYPLLGMFFPAIFNGLLVGWELELYIGGGFWINALYVAIGELAVLLVLGTALYYAFYRRNLQKQIF